MERHLRRQELVSRRRYLSKKDKADVNVLIKYLLCTKDSGIGKDTGAHLETWSRLDVHKGGEADAEHQNQPRLPMRGCAMWHEQAVHTRVTPGRL